LAVGVTAGGLFCFANCFAGAKLSGALPVAFAAGPAVGADAGCAPPPCEPFGGGGHCGRCNYCVQVWPYAHTTAAHCVPGSFTSIRI
jgi:hypothetical protein